jgi:hypothetical protein
MVRHKNRWLLVKVELAGDVRSNQQQPSIVRTTTTTTTTAYSSSRPSPFPSKKEFLARLRRTVSWCFGIAGEGPAYDTQIRFCDPDTRLVVVRVPRDSCGMIRSALTLLLTRKQLASLGETTRTMEATQPPLDYLASVISVHGSARTAKIAVFRKLRELYRMQIQESRAVFPNDDRIQSNLCRALQERLALVQNNLN